MLQAQGGQRAAVDGLLSPRRQPVRPRGGPGCTRSGLLRDRCARGDSCGDAGDHRFRTDAWPEPAHHVLREADSARHHKFAELCRRWADHTCARAVTGAYRSAACHGDGAAANEPAQRSTVPRPCVRHGAGDDHLPRHQRAAARPLRRARLRGLRGVRHVHRIRTSAGDALELGDCCCSLVPGLILISTITTPILMAVS